MRIRIVFKLVNKGAVLPFHHQSLLYALLKEHAEQHGLYFDHITFSGLKGQTKVCREGLKYTSRNVTLVLSSMHRSLLETITFSLFQQNELHLGDLMLSPEWVEAEASPKFKERMQYLCISPLIPYPLSELQELGFFLKAPYDLSFEELVRKSLQEQMYKEGNFSSKDLESVQDLRFLPDMQYLDRLSKRDKKYARDYIVHTDQGPIEAKGYTFPFTLSVNPVVQKFVFQTGLGSCSKHGFGMLDLAGTQLQRQELFHRRDLESGKVINPLEQKEEVRKLVRK